MITKDEARKLLSVVIEEFKNRDLIDVSNFDAFFGSKSYDKIVDIMLNVVNDPSPFKECEHRTVYAIYKDSTHETISHYRCVTCGEKHRNRFGLNVVFYGENK